jgi:hypothetical protein
MNDNKSTISVITSTVAASAFLCVVEVCVLSYSEKKIPSELAQITAALIGSLVSMLVKTSPSQTTTVTPDPIKTEIVNKPESPVPVTTEGQQP